MKTIKPIAVHVDRLAAALSEQGIDIRRTKTLELVAAAFGYHNTHECTAASQRGDLTPPAAEPVCRVEIPTGEALIVLRDPVTNAPYAIDESFIEQVVEDERREAYGPSPYGRLLDLSAVGAHPATAWSTTAGSVPSPKEGVMRILVELERTGAVTDEVVRSNVHQAIHGWRSNVGLSADDDEGMIGEIMTRVLAAGDPVADSGDAAPDQLLQALRASGRSSIHVALIHSKHGIELRLGTTLAGVSRQVGEYVRDNWHSAYEADKYAEDGERVDIPETPEGLDDDKAEELYFQAVGRYSASDYVDYQVIDLDDPRGRAGQPSVPAYEPFPGVPASLYTVNASRDGHVVNTTFKLDEGENEEDRGREIAAKAFGLELDDYCEEAVEDDEDMDDPDEDLTEEEKAEAEQDAEDQARDERNQNFDADIDSIEIYQASFDDMLLPVLKASWDAAQKLPADDPLRKIIRNQVMEAMPRAEA